MGVYFAAYADGPVTDPVFYYYHSDHLGSATIMTNRDGDIVQHYGYNAFGSERYKNNTAAFDVTNRYTGQQIDEETGLYFYQSRYYDANLGRFTQADTVVPSDDTSQALNRYTYVKNNPLKFTDPDGHGWFSSLWKSIKGFVGTIITAALYASGWGAFAASFVGSLIGTIVNGGNFKSFAIGFGIGIAAGYIANGIGGYFGGGVKAFAEWAKEGIGAYVAGALTGAVSGAISSAVYGGKVLKNILQGAMSGAIGTAVSNITEAVTTELKSWVQGTSATQEQLSGYGADPKSIGPQDTDTDWESYDPFFGNHRSQELPGSCLAASGRNLFEMLNEKYHYLKEGTIRNLLDKVAAKYGYVNDWNKGTFIPFLAEVSPKYGIQLNMKTGLSNTDIASIVAKKPVIVQFSAGQSLHSVILQGVASISSPNDTWIVADPSTKYNTHARFMTTAEFNKSYRQDKPVLIPK